MGCQNSTIDESDGGAQHSRALDRLIMNDKAASMQVYKLLLLGTGNSGKSTFFKQLTQIHAGGLGEEDYRLHTKTIQGSVIIQMENLLKSFMAPNTTTFTDRLPPELMEPASRIAEASGKRRLSDVAEDINVLWSHAAMKEAFVNRDNLGIADSAPHFFDSLSRIQSADYVPTFQDILLARIPTAGMLEKVFEMKGTNFKIVDVGGQRSERSKWIHCFEMVHAILFVASLSCYDQYLYEQEDLNAMHESLNLFSHVTASRYFRNTTMILFLNKSDLFQEKIKHKPLTVCFKEYEGQQTYQDCVQYIGKQFQDELEENNIPGRKRRLHQHVTCATDQNNVRKIFDDVQHLIVMRALSGNGLV